MNDGNKKAPTLQRQGLGVNHLEAIHMADVKAVQNGAQQLVRVFDGLIGGVPAQICDGRELHAFLKNGKQFADWIKQRIGQYGFEENLDFVSFSPKSEKPQAGRRSIEYHLTLDMAKELSMVESNEQGRMARRYFIDMERKALSQPSQPAPDQFERVTHAFRGGRVEFLAAAKRVWIKGSCIARALGLTGSDRITRSLPDDRKIYVARGHQRHVFIDPAAALLAAGYVRDVELAKAWEQWLPGIVKTFEQGSQQKALPDALMPCPTALERFGLEQLLNTKMLFSLDEQGRAQVKPIPEGALIVTPERLADVLRDPLTVPVEYLPTLMQVIAGRMGAVLQHTLRSR